MTDRKDIESFENNRGRDTDGLFVRKSIPASTQIATNIAATKDVDEQTSKKY